MSSPPKIFLSYATEDYEQVKSIFDRLKAEGFKPWMDKVDLLPGQKWEMEIPKALRESDFAIVFLSSVSVSKRGYVQKEFKLAQDVLDEMPEGQIFIIPAKLDDCDVPQKFSSLHWVNLYEKDGFSKIVKAIRAHTGTTASDADNQNKTKTLLASFLGIALVAILVLVIKPDLLSTNSGGVSSASFLDSFQGTWQGTATSNLVAYTVDLTIGLNESFVTMASPQATCPGRLELQDGDAEPLTFLYTATRSPGIECIPRGRVILSKADSHSINYIWQDNIGVVELQGTLNRPEQTQSPLQPFEGKRIEIVHYPHDTTIASRIKDELDKGGALTALRRSDFGGSGHQLQVRYPIAEGSAIADTLRALVEDEVGKTVQDNGITDDNLLQGYDYVVYLYLADLPNPELCRVSGWNQWVTVNRDNEGNFFGYSEFWPDVEFTESESIAQVILLRGGQPLEGKEFTPIPGSSSWPGDKQDPTSTRTWIPYFYNEPVNGRRVWYYRPGPTDKSAADYYEEEFIELHRTTGNYSVKCIHRTDSSRNVEKRLPMSPESFKRVGCTGPTCDDQ